MTANNTIRAVTEAIEQVAPLHYQESYDNAGLIVGHPDTPVTGILFSLDATEAVVAEAVALGCNLVVSHHPIVFRGLKRFNEATYVERTVMAAIRANVALYAAHTNLDSVLRQGVNEKIAQRLGLTDLRILSPKSPATPEVGSGLVGMLSTPTDELSWLQQVKQRMNAGVVRHTALLQRPVTRVAVCGGAGGFLLPAAIQAGADVFITADYKYHEFFDAEGKIVIADIGHYESEQFTIELLKDIVRENFPTFALHLTQVNTNPVKYI
jgi:dinuclear metal center YbgI/SA1388 family protein